jgi:crotonobetainyl-CoA:carnitine CoA-transferase CaiB-like acyl-CoA transferase
MFEAFQRGDIMRRIGVNRFWPTFPVGIYETKQGWLGVTTVTPAQWRAFCEMLGLLDLRDDPTLIMGVDRLKRVAEIEGRILPKLMQRTAQEWFAEGLARKIPIVPVPEIADLIADEEKRARGAIVPVTIGKETGFSAGTMQRLTGTPPLRGGRVPDIGEQQARREAAPRAPIPTPAATIRLPLEGIRVVDFSMGWAGPICTRTLADLGADVIKIEAIQYPDWWRGVDRRPAYVLEQMYEKSVRYCIMNRNKRGITLDLTRPKGLALAKRLLADADVVVDNYSVEVLPKLGLGYEVLSKINPKLVMMSMSAFGAGSVHRDCRAYGSTLEQGSGLPSVVGDAGGPPVMSHTAFGDAVGGLNGCAAVLTALIHAKLTGQGQFIDLAQIECMMPFAASWIVAHSVDGKPPTKYGNRHPDLVPHGCFRCAGEDNWIVVAASDDAMWPKLARLLDRADWVADGALATAAGRRAIESQIEAAINAWSSVRDPDDAMAALQVAGVAAGVARLPIELLNDPQLHARGFIQQVDRAFIGQHPQPSMPFRESAEPLAIRSVPPTLGEHNREILGGMLGLSDTELAELTQEGIIGTEMLMEEQLVKEKKRAAG